MFFTGHSKHVHDLGIPMTLTVLGSLVVARTSVLITASATWCWEHLSIIRLSALEELIATTAAENEGSMA